MSEMSGSDSPAGNERMKTERLSQKLSTAHKDGEKSKAFIENPPHVFLTQQQTMTADLLQL